MASSLFPSPGPSLPSFNSLLVKGPYPPSAPLHLCLSHLQANAGNVLFLSPSRQAFATPLQDFNDQWLTTNAAKGQQLNLLSRVQIYYPPTTAHWLLLLSLFKPLSSYTAIPNKAALSHAPSLIVLHEPSAYFISAGSSQPYVDTYRHAEGAPSASSNLSQYLQLITTALSTASFLSSDGERATPLVLFDSHLGDLKLPIVRPVTPSRRLFTNRPESPARQDKVEKFVETYFEWIGSVHDEYPEETPRTPPHQHGTFDTETGGRSSSFKLKLERRLPIERDIHGSKIIIEWSEMEEARNSYSPLRGTRFVFKTDE